MCCFPPFVSDGVHGVWRISLACVGHALHMARAQFSGGFAEDDETMLHKSFCDGAGAL